MNGGGKTKSRIYCPARNVQYSICEAQSQAHLIKTRSELSQKDRLFLSENSKETAILQTLKLEAECFEKCQRGKVGNEKPENPLNIETEYLSKKEKNE